MTACYGYQFIVGTGPTELSQRLDLLSDPFQTYTPTAQIMYTAPKLFECQVSLSSYRAANIPKCH